MSKLAILVSMRRDMAFDFERELRAVRDLILGAQRLSGKECTIDLGTGDGYVASSRARSTFAGNVRVALHEALLQYAHDLAHESLELGVPQSTVEDALGVERASMKRDASSVAAAQRRDQDQIAATDIPHVRLAAVAG